MYEKFGAGWQDDGRYGFRLFVPDNSKDATQYVRGGDCKITDVRVVGDFQNAVDNARQNWDYGDGLVMTKQAHPNGRLFAYTLPPQFPASLDCSQLFTRDRSTEWLRNEFHRTGNNVSRQ